MYGKTTKSESSKLINSIYIVGIKDYDIECNKCLINKFISYRYEQKSFSDFI